ncbi:sensor domain-containing diguanylate cyclase [Herbaspirillum lusitanum]|jgi:diguanylate cyclase (GGDEF)-like protein|uniref:diguanylate cyclase n=1 Tax=Herbaspirillum lusitanum TaxID=213312 RepID=A0ABW9A558_9BURK
MSRAGPVQSTAEEVIRHVNLGLIVIDHDLKVVLWNDWMVRHSGVSQEQALQQNFIALFSQQLAPGFLRALNNAISYGLPAVLSSALHRSPLPLYPLQASEQMLSPDGEVARMVQSVIMTPIACETGNESAGGHCCLIQISDASSSVRREKMLLSHSETLKRQVVTDGLTGVYNRRFFDEGFALALQQARRNQSSLSLFMIDIDFFKQYNDHYGHVEGDRVLKLVAETLQQQLMQASDIFARYGGEEFIMLVPELAAAEAREFAEKLRTSVLVRAEPHEKSGAGPHLTISVGVCTGLPEHDADGRSLLARADAALYRAKQLGRNQVVAAG